MKRGWKGRGRKVSLPIRTHDCIDFLQIITIIYINNNLQGFRRGKKRQRQLEGRIRMEEVRDFLLLMSLYRALLTLFFLKQVLTFLKQLRGKDTECSECLSATGYATQKRGQGHGMLAALVRLGSAREWNHPGRGSGCPLAEQWGCYSNLLSDASTSSAST